MKNEIGKSRVAVLLTLILGLPLCATAQDFNRPDVAPLPTVLVMELKVAIGAPVSVGESDTGVRRFIPITGGEFEGTGIRGEVLAGGADWQLVRPDGVTEIEAIYAIRTDDGAVINVNNKGVAVNVPANADGNAEAFRYVRTQPQFQAPRGKYEWLNQRFFTGTITVGPPGFVTIRVFQVN